MAARSTTRPPRIDAHQAVAPAGQFAAHLGLRIEDLP